MICQMQAFNFVFGGVLWCHSCHGQRQRRRCWCIGGVGIGGTFGCAPEAHAPNLSTSIRPTRYNSVHSDSTKFWRTEQSKTTMKAHPLHKNCHRGKSTITQQPCCIRHNTAIPHFCRLSFPYDHPSGIISSASLSN